MDYDLKQKGWFPDAAEFAAAIGHASNYPMSYVYALFMALSGHILGRRTYIRYATPLYANHFICLVGPSGISHKSTAMSLAVEALGDCDIPLITSVTTSQGLLQAMANNDGSILIRLDEMATMLAQKRQDYAANLIASLTELYGCPNTYGTYTRHSPIIIKDTFTTMIAGSTIEWLQQSLTANDLMGGFGNRMTFVLGDPRPELTWPRLPYLDDLDWSPLYQFEGQVRLEESGREVWDRYYEYFQALQKESNPFVQVLSERIPEKILKAALVMAAWKKVHLIEADMMDAAIHWGRYLHKCVIQLTPAFQQVEHQVLDAIRGGLDTKAKLFGAMSHSIESRKLKEALDILKWLGEVALTDDGRLYAKRKN